MVEIDCRKVKNNDIKNTIVIKWFISYDIHYKYHPTKTVLTTSQIYGEYWSLKMSRIVKRVSVEMVQTIIDNVGNFIRHRSHTLIQLMHN